MYHSFCVSRLTHDKPYRRDGRKQKVAKAYGVFMDEELNKKYHFFLDHPVSRSDNSRRAY